MKQDYHKLPEKHTNYTVPKQNYSPVMAYTEFLQSKPKALWGDYKIYLKSKGALSPKLYATV